MRRMLLVALGLACACDSPSSPASEDPPDHTLCGNGVVNLPDETCDQGERNSDTDLHACRTDCSGQCRCSRYFECAVAGDSYTCSGECPEGYEEYTDPTSGEGYERFCELVGVAVQVVSDAGGEPVDGTPYDPSYPVLLAELDGETERVAVIPTVPPTVEVAIEGMEVASGEQSPWIDVVYGSNLVELVLTDTVEMWSFPITVVVQDGMDLSYVKASNTDADDRFGEAVSVDGDTMVIGATGEASAATGIDGDQDDDSAPGRGAVYVFRHDGAAWSQEAYIKPAAADERYFGSGVALSGDALAVRGSSGLSLFRRDGATWSAQGTLPSTTCAYRPHLVGDTLAFLCDEEVRIYRADGDQWTLEATLIGADAPGGFRLDDIALGGDTLAAMGTREEADRRIVLTTLVFRRSGTTWALEESLCVDPRECAGETELSRDGTRMAVRAGFEGDDRHRERIHVLARGPDGWVEEITIVKYYPDDFGSSLRIDGDRLAIRSLYRAGWVTNLYERDASGWHHLALIAHPTLMNGGNLFWHLDLTSGFLVMPAPKESSGATGIGGDFLDTSAPEAGAAFVLTLPPP